MQLFACLVPQAHYFCAVLGHPLTIDTVVIVDVWLLGVHAGPELFKYAQVTVQTAPDLPMAGGNIATDRLGQKCNVHLFAIFRT